MLRQRRRTRRSTTSSRPRTEPVLRFSCELINEMIRQLIEFRTIRRSWSTSASAKRTCRSTRRSCRPRASATRRARPGADGRAHDRGAQACEADEGKLRGRLILDSEIRRRAAAPWRDPMRAQRIPTRTDCRRARRRRDAACFAAHGKFQPRGNCRRHAWPWRPATASGAGIAHARRDSPGRAPHRTVAHAYPVVPFVSRYSTRPNSAYRGRCPSACSRRTARPDSMPGS